MEKLAYIDVELINNKPKHFNINYKLLVNKFYKFIETYNNIAGLNYRFTP